MDEPLLTTANRDQIIKIAKQNNVDAIIPGYGFLSENSDFARDAAAAGIVFAGPSPESIEAFGLKHTARDLATKAGVPIVPGSKGLVQSEDEAVELSKSLGFPVCNIKTSTQLYLMALTVHRLCSKQQQAAVEWACSLAIRSQKCESHLLPLDPEAKPCSKTRGCSLNDTTLRVIISKSKFSVTGTGKRSISVNVNVPFKDDTRRSSKNVPVLLFPDIRACVKSWVMRLSVWQSL